MLLGEALVGEVTVIAADAEEPDETVSDGTNEHDQGLVHAVPEALKLYVSAGQLASLFFTPTS